MLADLLDLTQPLLWTVPDVLSPEECAALIARIEAAGPAAAPITTSAGFVMRPDIRNNSRAVIDDEALAAELFRRVRPRLPPRMRDRGRTMEVVGANERLRCYRYEPGQRFASHYDGRFQRDAREWSLLTFMIYLNEGFSGGETDFPMQGQRIQPQTGTALLFQHHLLHEGRTVTSGVKYALRSDVMYRLLDEG